MAQIYTQNTATMNETAYDQALGTPAATGRGGGGVSASTQAVIHTIALKPAAATTVRYGFTGPGDTPDATLDATSTLVERYLGLPGGSSVTIRTGTQVWSYPNIHGDIIAVANSTGVKQGSTYNYDPFGTSLSATGAVPDNSNAAYDYGWLGQHQRGLEHGTPVVPTIEMGARQYVPQLGRFLETDPIEGGSANDYDYVHADPVNGLDLAGTCDGFGFCSFNEAAHNAAGGVKDAATSAWDNTGGKVATGVANTWHWMERNLTPTGVRNWWGTFRRGCRRTTRVRGLVGISFTSAAGYNFVRRELGKSVLPTVIVPVTLGVGIANGLCATAG
jgi:RHS repeat-associated protein